MSLRAEHSLVDDAPFDSDHDIVPSLLTADLIVSRCSELRSLLDLYAAALRTAFTLKTPTPTPAPSEPRRTASLEQLAPSSLRLGASTHVH
jgi:hypothetical protein